MSQQTNTEVLAGNDRKLREFESEIGRLREELSVLREETIHDRDTALFSTAYFHTRLQEEILRSERYRHFLSLILVHVDARSGSTSTHLSRELRRVGRELMAGLTRRTDIVAIYRKRQMIVMLPETDHRGANLLIKRYSAMFPNNGRKMTYSVLTYPNDASNMEMVLNRLQDVSEDLFRRPR